MDYTKGKLEVSNYNRRELWIEADKHIATVHGTGNTLQPNIQRICQCWNSHDDLLATCKILVKTLWATGSDPEINQVVEKAKQAIAEAEA